MKRLRYVAIFTLAFCLFLLLFTPAKADHQIYLPYAGETWLAKIIQSNQEYTFCTDSRAASYPSFLSQLRDVNQEYAQRTGIRAREVAFDSSCQVQHVMLPEFPCGSGAAACIYYGNAPVVIHYQENLGFTDWRSAQGHELGHGILGQLHEMYRDSGGSIECLRDRTWTVMSCGTGVRYPQQIDIDRGCAIILTSWCGRDGTVVCEFAGDPYWNPCVGRWVFSNGWSYEPVSAVWWNPQGQAEWEACNSLGHRWNIIERKWYRGGVDAFFDPVDNFWTFAGGCS